jgi:hypothetical protein
VYVDFKVFTALYPDGTALTGPAVFLGGNTGGVAAGFRDDINANQWNQLGDIKFQDIGARYQAAGLLHELGHIYSLLSGLGSGGSDIKFDGLDLPWQASVSDANTDLILNDCFGITN